MTCQDIMELMQRSLDHDLNETEKQQLKLHVEQCLGCAELFERLRHLDAELSQLPKITPAYSLVDAIMPQLSQLDRLPVSLEETAAREPDAPAIAQPGGIPRTRRSLFSWKIASGTAVAAAVIGLFVLKEQNLIITPSNGAQGAAVSSAGVAKKSAAADMKAADKTPTVENKTHDETANIVADRLPKENTVSPQHKPRPAATESVKAEAAHPSSSSAGEPAKPKAAARGTNDPGQGRSVEISSPREPGNNQPAEKSTAPSSVQMKPAAKLAEPVNPPAGIAAAPDGGTASDPGQPAADTPVTKPQQPKRGFAALLAPQAAEVKSADGKLAAVVQEQRVIVRSAVSGETLYSSVYSWSESDRVTLIGWSADNKLTYQVQHTDTSETFVLNPTAKTEAKVAAPVETTNSGAAQK